MSVCVCVKFSHNVVEMCVCVKFSFLKVIFAHACHFQSIPGSLSEDFEVAICFCVLFFQCEFIQEFEAKWLMLE